MPPREPFEEVEVPRGTLGASQTGWKRHVVHRRWRRWSDSPVRGVSLCGVRLILFSDGKYWGSDADRPLCRSCDGLAG